MKSSEKEEAAAMNELEKKKKLMDPGHHKLLKIQSLQPKFMPLSGGNCRRCHSVGVMPARQASRSISMGTFLVRICCSAAGVSGMFG